MGIGKPGPPLVWRSAHSHSRAHSARAWPRAEARGREGQKPPPRTRRRKPRCSALLTRPERPEAPRAYDRILRLPEPETKSCDAPLCASGAGRDGGPKSCNGATRRVQGRGRAVPFPWRPSHCAALLLEMKMAGTTVWPTESITLLMSRICSSVVRGLEGS